MPGVSKTIGCSIFLFILVFAVYMPSISYEFIWDDLIYVNSFGGKSLIKEIVSSFKGESSEQYIQLANRAYYRPFTNLTFIIEKRIYGLNPTGYHMTNLLLHLIAVLLLYKLLESWTGNCHKSLVASAIFAVFPLHIESVTWISGRTDILSTVFILSALLVHHSSYFSSGRKLYINRAMTVIFFILAILSKELGYILIILIPLVDILIYKNRTNILNRRSVVLYLVLLISALFFIYIRINIVLYDDPVQLFYPDFKIWLISLIAAFAQYSARLFYPFAPDPYIINPYQQSFISFKFITGLFLILIIASLIKKYWKKRPFIVLAILFIPIGLIPVTNAYRIESPLDMGFTMADRFCYFPSIGLSIIISLLLYNLLRDKDESIIVRSFQKISFRKLRHFYNASLIIVVLFSGVTMVNSNEWSDEKTFYNSVIKKHPDVLLMRLNLANYYYRNGSYKEALQLIGETEKISNEDNVELLNLKGLLLFSINKPAEAISYLDKAFKIDPNNLTILNNLGTIYLKLGSPTQAEKYFKSAGVLYPNDVNSQLGLAISLDKMGYQADAEKLYKYIVNHNPNNTEALINYGIYLFREGEYEEGEELLRRAVELNPNDYNALYNLAAQLTLYTDKLDDALDISKKSVRIKPNFKEAYLLISEIYLQKSELNKAIRWVEKGMKMISKNDPLAIDFALKLKEINEKNKNR